MFSNSQSSFCFSRKSPSGDSNMIPLINIVFLMLIFFMVAGKITNKDAIQVDPPISNATTTAPVNEHSIILSADNSLWLDNTAWGKADQLSVTSWQQFSKAIAKNAKVMLTVDAQLPAASLDPLLQNLRASDIKNLQLAVQEAP